MVPYIFYIIALFLVETALLVLTHRFPDCALQWRWRARLSPHA